MSSISLKKISHGSNHLLNVIVYDQTEYMLVHWTGSFKYVESNDMMRINSLRTWSAQFFVENANQFRAVLSIIPRIQ